MDDHRPASNAVLTDNPPASPLDGQPVEVSGILHRSGRRFGVRLAAVAACAVVVIAAGQFLATLDDPDETSDRSENSQGFEISDGGLRDEFDGERGSRARTTGEMADEGGSLTDGQAVMPGRSGGPTATADLNASHRSEDQVIAGSDGTDDGRSGGSPGSPNAPVTTEGTTTTAPAPAALEESSTSVPALTVDVDTGDSGPDADDSDEPVDVSAAESTSTTVGSGSPSSPTLPPAADRPSVTQPPPPSDPPTTRRPVPADTRPTPGSGRGRNPRGPADADDSPRPGNRRAVGSIR